MGLLSPLWELRHGLWKVGALRSEALRFPSQAWVDPSCPSPGSGLHHHPLTHCGPGPPVPSSTCGFEVPNFSLALRTTLELLLCGGGANPAPGSLVVPTWLGAPRPRNQELPKSSLVWCCWGIPSSAPATVSPPRPVPGGGGHNSFPQ